MVSREPVLTVASITALVAATITVLAAFGLPLTNDQTQAILGLIAVAGPLVAALIARRKVTPVE
jgi:hypothetical protein